MRRSASAVGSLQPSFSLKPFSFSPVRFWSVLGACAGLMGIAATHAWAAAASTSEAAPEFGKDVQLAPFVVSGKKVAVAIHARTDSDRRYGEKFAAEVLEVAYHTLPDAKGRGLVIVGREGEPHPVEVMRRFLALAESGQLQPELSAKAAGVTALMKELKANLHLDQQPATKEGEHFKITFEMVMPALPLPLEGVMGKLYQLSWAEGFDPARTEQKLRALTLADLQGSALSSYEWVFYLPPRDAYVAVQDTVVKQAMKQEKMSFLKRTTMKSALLVFKPAVKKAVEAMRRGMLYMTVLRADGGVSREDVSALTQAYVKVLMPDFKFTSGSERDRALAAVDAQKLLNEDYAKNPFVAPPRLKDFEPAAYARFEGAYGEPKSKSVSRLTRDADGVYQWQVNQRKPVAFYPAGERLFVSADARQTIEFKLNEQGDITGAEGRRYRQRWQISGKLKPEVPKER